MALLRKDKWAKAREMALKSDALTFDLEIDGDYMRSDLRPSERAFQLLWCSFDLLLAITNGPFPAIGRHSAKGSKYMRQDLFLYGGKAARFLAHAFPTLLEATQGCLASRTERLDPELPPEHFGVLAEVVKDFYPLAKGEPQLLVDALAEFRLLEAKEMRPAVAKGEAPGSRYAQAVLRGEDPDADPELVEEQWNFARDYFINQAGLGSGRFLLRQDFKRMRLAHALLDMAEAPPERETDRYRRGALKAWIEGSRRYLEFARLDHSVMAGQLSER
jgi:hypothetical protein